MVDPDWKKCAVYTLYSFGLHTYVQSTIFASTPTNDGVAIAHALQLPGGCARALLCLCTCLCLRGSERGTCRRERGTCRRVCVGVFA